MNQTTKPTIGTTTTKKGKKEEKQKEEEIGTCPICDEPDFEGYHKAWCF